MLPVSDRTTTPIETFRNNIYIVIPPDSVFTIDPRAERDTIAKYNFETEVVFDPASLDYTAEDLLGFELRHLESEAAHIPEELPKGKGRNPSLITYDFDKFRLWLLKEYSYPSKDSPWYGIVCAGWVGNHTVNMSEHKGMALRDIYKAVADQ